MKKVVRLAQDKAEAKRQAMADVKAASAARGDDVRQILREAIRRACRTRILSTSELKRMLKEQDDGSGSAAQSRFKISALSAGWRKPLKERWRNWPPS